MNILMVHPHDLFAKSEPWTIRIKSIAKEFSKRMNSVKLCYFPRIPQHEHYPQKINSVELVPIRRAATPINYVLTTKKLIKLCQWADVLHLQKCHHYASMPAAMACYITGTPFHYDWDDWEEKIWYESVGKTFRSKFIGVSYKLLERTLPVLTDSTSCASNYLKKLAHAYGARKEQIYDSPVGADIEKFRPGLDGDRVKKKYGINGDLVLYVGQLHGAQYVDLFIRAAGLVLNDFPDVTFMIVGEGFLEIPLKKLAQDLGLGNKVIFAGSISHEEVPFYIASASICVAAFQDTKVTRCKSPLKIVEYLASGKPIVASNVGEVKNMVGKGGILVEPGDPHALAEGICKLIQDKGMREKLGRFARQRAEDIYNWPKTASSLLKAYEAIL